MTTRLQVRDSDVFYTATSETVGGDNSAPIPMGYVVAALNGFPAVVIETVAGELDHPMEHVSARCPAGNLIRDPGVPVFLDWSVAKHDGSALTTRGGCS